MKSNTLVLFWVWMALGSAVICAGDVDSLLAEKMLANPDGQFHVIAFFQDRLTPEQAILQNGIRGEECEIARQVVAAYKTKTEGCESWLQGFSESRQLRLERICRQDHLQAVSFTATAEAIWEIAQQGRVEKISLFTPENTRPEAFFDKQSYYMLQEPIITYVDDATDNTVNIGAQREEIEIDPEKIINILKKIFDFIKENQPVVNTSVDQASAVPQGTSHWQQLAEWRERHTGQYVIEYKNLYGITVVKIVLRIHFYHSGNYNGIGRYITCATASIDELNVLWGYTLNADVKIPDSGVVNIGTATAPVAAMRMFVHWAVHTIVQHQEGTMTFTLDGNGNVSSY